MTDTRPEPSTTAAERPLLVAFLDWHRETLTMKCEGLSAEQLRLRSVPPSNLSLLGLVRHMAEVERWWFQMVLAGETPGRIYGPPQADADFDDLESRTAEEAMAQWRAEVVESHRIVDGRSLDDTGAHPRTGEQFSVRWVLNHMVEEYARHNGHADLLRQAIDGAVGE